MTADLANANENQATLETEKQLQQQQIAPNLLADPNIKFPLENSWSFWFYKNEKTKKWEDNVKFITSVDFVEDFCLRFD